MPDTARLTAALGGRYAIEHELGRGGMATVYLARDVKHDRQVALKVLRPELAAVLGAERFLREIRISARLDHPHILTLIDSGESNGFLWYVLPFVHGESLRETLNHERQLDLGQALTITRQVGSALDYAHREGVIHRDIKPENILLHEGEAMLADFGIAMAVREAGGNRLTESGLSLGTPQYMSPEQATGERELDARSDVYSLGAVLYEMLTGEPPHTGTTVQAVIAKLLTERPTRVRTVRDTVPEGVDNAVARALAKVPADRFRSTGEFVQALVASPTAPSRGWRRPRVAIVAATVVGVGLVVATWLIAIQRPRGSPDTVAVLYFDNLSRDTSDAYVADGLTEELITRLGQIERLQVKSRTATQRYRGRPIDDPAALGRALGAAHLVSGSVQRGGGRLRVTVELTRAATGVRVWGESYDRSSDDLMAVEVDIAQAIAAGVGGRLAPAERRSLAARPTLNPAAYDYFLRGNYFLARRSPREVRLAIEQYEQAVRVDSGFTGALARIGYGYGLFLDWGWEFPGLTRDSVLARAFAVADRALALDSSAADAWMTRGYLLSFRFPRTYEGVNAAFDRAIALDPRNAEAHHQYGYLLMTAGEDARGRAELERALALEPERPISLVVLANAQWLAHHDAASRRLLDSALAVDPGAAYAYASRSMSWLATDVMDARADAEAAVHLCSTDCPIQAEAALAAAEFRAGDTAAARARLEPLFRSPAARGMQDGYKTAVAFAVTGDRDRALAVLERIVPRGAVLWWFMRDPWFDAIRPDPRFQRLVEESRPPGVPTGASGR